MTEYRVGEEGATVFDADGHLLAHLEPGTLVVPGSVAGNLEPRTPDQEYPTRRAYDDKVVRPEHGPAGERP